MGLPMLHRHPDLASGQTPYGPATLSGPPRLAWLLGHSASRHESLKNRLHGRLCYSLYFDEVITLVADTSAWYPLSMTNYLVINKKDIVYAIKVSRRARAMRMTMHRDGQLVVTLPREVNHDRVETFIRQQARWIFKKSEYFKKFPLIQLGSGAESQFSECRGQALARAQEVIRRFNRFYNFSVPRIMVKDQKTCWGSCSKKGNLNFNYRIALLPEHLVDYIIVHELCHRGELNHSAKFWILVARTIPDHQARRKELKRFALRQG